MGYDAVDYNTTQQGADSTALGTYLQSTLYCGVQSPINGLSQLADRALGTNSLPSVQLIDAPDTRNHPTAAALGDITATIGHCSLMLAASRRLGGPVTESFANIPARAAWAGGMGTIYGGVLTPVANNHENFWASRAMNAAAGGIGMAAMSASTSFYKDWMCQDAKAFDRAVVMWGVMVPGMQAGIAVGADDYLSASGSGGVRWTGSVFNPGNKTRPLEQLMPRRN
ncbi:MAG: hypothetical protein K2Z81_22770 [Cyanobacteria bacterium]|nr:hypothetical protein [Cyanobacteriota bacterium]